uniref:Uncharacterized protein n=1 Tax=Oryza brachyantha TaxID=4533 RepID=J3M1W6_ORYBR
MRVFQTTYIKEAVTKAATKKVAGRTIIPHWVLTVFTIGSTVATMLYKSAKASKEIDGIASHLIKKCEKILESQAENKLPESQAEKVKTPHKLPEIFDFVNQFFSRWIAHQDLFTKRAQVNRVY